MRIKFIFSLFLRTSLSMSLLTLVNSWSCFQDGKAMPVIPHQVAGVWYEIARLPSSDVPACLKITAPEAELSGNYTLELDYINNVNKDWKPTRESLVFPWDDAANGKFNLRYSDGTVTINVQFKYLGSLRGYSLVCGYTDFASGLSMIRILSRNKLVDRSVKTQLDLFAKQFHIDLSDLTWVQQDGRCNGSDNLAISNVGVFLALVFLQIILTNNLWAFFLI